jgi:hypothetical protein
MKPSDISGIYPWSSVMQNSECETVAKNIMLILKRTGDTFREISEEEYRTERLKDYAKNPQSGSLSYREIETFDRVKNVAKSPALAARFCKDWSEALDKAG